jgi:hypothetical protein
MISLVGNYSNNNSNNNSNSNKSSGDYDDYNNNANGYDSSNKGKLCELKFIYQSFFYIIHIVFVIFKSVKSILKSNFSKLGYKILN